MKTPEMSNQEKFLKLLQFRPYWSISDNGLAELMTEIAKQTAFEIRGYAALKPTTYDQREGKIVIIPIQGILTKDGPSAGTTYGFIQDAADAALRDPNVKKVVLAVDSPGGEVTGLPETAAVIRQLARAKPVHAIVEGTAASAAYWLTSQATDITLTPSGEVGSVGVRVMHMDVSKALEDAGYKITELFSGDYKTEWTPFSPLTKEAKADMQGRLDSLHKDFLSDVGQGRGTRARAGIRSARFGEGRMFPAGDALNNGMVDAVKSKLEFHRSLARVGRETPAIHSTEIARQKLELLRAQM